MESSKAGLQTRLADQESSLGQMKQSLVRTTLAKQTLEVEKKELIRRVEELESSLDASRSDLGEKEKIIQRSKSQIEEIVKRHQRESQGSREGQNVSWELFRALYYLWHHVTVVYNPSGDH